LFYSAIAPKVGAKFATEYRGQIMYGFFVEIVRVFPNDMNSAEFAQTREDLNNEIDKNEYDRSRIFDLHCYNIGKTKDGRPVAIDFSRFEDEDGFNFTNLRGQSFDAEGRRLNVDDETGTWSIV
jgi:hypothetical protein